MDFHTQSVREAFPFLRQVIVDAYKTDVVLYTHPYQHIGGIDRGFRNMLWGERERPSIFTEYLMDPTCYRLAVVRSSLGFYSIMASVSLSQPPDFINVGPFCDGKLSDAFIHRIISDKNLSSEQRLLAEKFYEILPAVDVNDITIMVLHLLSAFIPEYHNVTPEYINYSEETNKITPNHEAFRTFSSTSAEYYAKYLKDFLNALASGDYKETSDKLKIFLDANGTLKTHSLHLLKKGIQEINTFCKERLILTSIPPYNVLRLSDQISQQIDNAKNDRDLVNLPYQMVRKYCLLVQNYSFSEYSYLVRNTIQYIHQNLENELSLSSIAEHFGKNASFLSAQFSKETGESLTSYIHRIRIQTAIQYFNTTDLSVTEVAAKSGIYNTTYFSRMFKEQVGVTPREYKKMLKT